MEARNRHSDSQTLGRATRLIYSQFCRNGSFPICGDLSFPLERAQNLASVAEFRLESTPWRELGYNSTLKVYFMAIR
jgi:hypothetical protein